METLKHWRQKVSQCRKKVGRLNNLVSCGIAISADKGTTTIAQFLAQTVQLGSLKFCRTFGRFILVSSCGLKKRVTILVAFHDDQKNWLTCCFGPILRLISNKTYVLNTHNLSSHNFKLFSNPSFSSKSGVQQMPTCLASPCNRACRLSQCTTCRVLPSTNFSDLL